jgi:hypothetical protein
MAFLGRSNIVQGRLPVPWQGVALVLGTFGFSWWLQAWPAVPGRWSASEAVDAALLADDLRAVVGDGAPRVVGTAEAARGRDRIAGRFTALGLEVERQRVRIERRAGAVELENLVARMPGSPGTAGGAPSRGAIGVVAHSDSAPGAPGASDDGAGVAAVLAVARALRERPAAHDVILLVTDGEERGLLGAQAFMAQHPRAAELRAAVNLDARGAAGSANVFETGPQTAWCAEVVARHVSAPRAQSLAAEVYRRMPNGTDFTVFLGHGVTGFNVAFIGDAAAYHSPDDTFARQSAQSRAHMARTALELVRGIDAALPADGGAVPDGRAAYGDVAGLAFVRWPEAWCAPMASAAGVALLGAAAWRAARSRRGAPVPGHADRRAPLGPAGLAVAGGLAALAASAAVGWALGEVAARAGVASPAAGARMLVFAGLSWTGALVAALGARQALAGRGARGWDLLLGAWAPWTAVAVAAAFALPAASPMALLPLLAAAAGAVAAAALGRGPGLAAWAGFVTALACWVPLEPLLLDALGTGPGAVVGLRAGLVLLPIAAIGVPRTHDAPGAGPGAS